MKGNQINLHPFPSIPVRLQHGDPAPRSHQQHRAVPRASLAAHQGTGSRAAGGHLPGQGRPPDHPGRLRQLQGGGGRAQALPHAHGVLHEL